MIRAYHAPSGSVLIAEVLEEVGTAPHRSWRVVPEGLLEAVILREEVWSVTNV